MVKPLMARAAELRASRQALAMLRLLVAFKNNKRNYTMALKACAAAKDLRTARAIVELAEGTLPPGKGPDYHLYVTYIAGEASTCIV